MPGYKELIANLTARQFPV